MRLFICLCQYGMNCTLLLITSDNLKAKYFTSADQAAYLCCGLHVVLCDVTGWYLSF